MNDRNMRERAALAAQLVSRFFSRRDKTVKEVAMGVFLCPVCDVFTEDASKHRHGEFLE